MKEKITHPLIKNKTAKKVYSLLFQKEMSVKDLSIEIYNNKNSRNEITKWIKLFLKNKWIYRTDLSTITKEKTYRANLNPFIENLPKKDIKIIESFMYRFWKPISRKVYEDFWDNIFQPFIIKKVMKIKKKSVGYDPSKDLKEFKKNKEKFWNDSNYRKEFLDRINKEYLEHYNKGGVKNYVRWDFVFFSLIMPDEILNKLNSVEMGSSFSTIISLLES